MSADHEWLKILVSTLAGLFAGVMLEPMKRRLQWEHDMSRMLNAVLIDWLNVQLQLGEVARGRVGKDSLNLHMDGFDYYWETKRELFYETVELQILRSITHNLGLLRQLDEKEAILPAELVAEAEDYVSQIKGLHLEPSTTKRLFRRVIPKSRRKRETQTSAWLKGKSGRPNSGPRDVR